MANKNYRVRARTLDDLKNIARYTEHNRGKSQRNKYLKALEPRFSWLAKNPKPGKYRSEIEQGYYSFPEGQHVVVLHNPPRLY